MSEKRVRMDREDELKILESAFGPGVTTTRCPRVGAEQWTCSQTDCHCHLRNDQWPIPSADERPPS